MTPTTTWLSIDASTFEALFNRLPFRVTHGLADHPLLTLPALVQLAQRLPRASVRYNSGNVSVSDGLYVGPQTGLSVDETIRQIEECRSWMVLTGVEQDPPYEMLLNQCLEEIHPLVGPLVPGMLGRQGFIFVSSPGAVTPCHIDPEYNFLLQIRGSKTMHVFDPADRSVISEPELETHLNAQNETGFFRESSQVKAYSFDLAPGHGVHVPFAAPHWVKVHDASYSISFSVTWRSPASERQVHVYAVNRILRRWGLRPRPYGRSRVADSMKTVAFRACRRSRRLLERQRT